MDKWVIDQIGNVLVAELNRGKFDEVDLEGVILPNRKKVGAIELNPTPGFKIQR